ncbi:MAG: B12-binding domain-containing radical SAM protein [Elusimicrobia bacterium]|nr:B12-binding domain-containing radical SAM protein [Elusimicrobiota bacterium]
MKIGLIYPPARSRGNECFLLPTQSLPALAGALRGAGHEAAIFDFDSSFWPRLLEPRSKTRFEILADPDKVPAYLRGELGAGETRRLDVIRKELACRPSLRRCDLYGISLNDLTVNNLFLLNAAALIAREIKDRFPAAPVVAGGEIVSRAEYREILARYPVFDHAIWAAYGEEPFLRLIRRLNGENVGLLQTWLRVGPDIQEHAAAQPRPACPPSDYAGYPLANYRVTPEALCARYAAAPRLLRSLTASPAGRRAQLIAPYIFEGTCPRRCAFCATGSSDYSNRKSIEVIVNDLLVLKKRGVTGFFFLNPNFNSDYDSASRLCDAMIEAGLNLPWSDSANLQHLDEALLRKMRRAGAVKLVFGMETFSRRLLKYIRKGISKERIERCLRLSHGLGIWNHIELISGLPTETGADVRETASFIRKLAPSIDAYSLNPFLLFRNSPFYREADAFGIRPHSGPPKGGMASLSERFDEIGGPDWPRKEIQTRLATLRLAQTIDAVSSKTASDQDHIHLLMYLYGRLGHERKALIRKIFKQCTGRFKPYHSLVFFGRDSYASKADYNPAPAAAADPGAPALRA